MSDESVPLPQIAWRQLCPWLMIFRCFRLSVSLPLLGLATLGTILTPLGWLAGEGLFSVAVKWRPYAQTLPRVDLAPLTTGTDTQGGIASVAGQVLSGNVVGVYGSFVRPVAELVEGKRSLPEIAYYVLGILWTVLVWAIFAGAITRIAAVQLGRADRVSLPEALRHVRRNYGWYFVAPFFPILGVVLSALPIVLCAWVMRWDWGVVLAGLVWPLVLVGGLIMAVCLLGLLFGWPLMWPAISAEEGGDAFEAFSRSFAYTFRQPLYYLFCAAVVVGYGALCWLLVSAVSSAVVEASYRAAAWSAGSSRIIHVAAWPDDNAVLFAGATLIHLSVLLVQTIAAAFNHSFFWCTATAIYLLLRRAVDQTEFDEVYVEDEATRYEVPSLEADQAASPAAADAPPAGAAPAASAAGDNQADAPG